VNADLGSSAEPDTGLLPGREGEYREVGALVIGDRAQAAGRMLFRLPYDRAAFGLRPGGRPIGVRPGAVVRQRPVGAPGPGAARPVFRSNGAPYLFLQVQRDIDPNPATYKVARSETVMPI
jgi:hypothetical protein